jgi:quinol monooxygenase YgiN
MAEIVCIAEFVSKEGLQNELQAQLQSLIAPTRAESGCLSYALHRAIECDKTFTMIERFKSKADFDFHSQQDYLKQFIQVAPSLTDSIKVSLSEAV